MSPTIILSDETFTRLQSLAVPFVDTPESVISGLIEAEVARRHIGTSAPSPKRATVEIDPDRPDSLTHAKLLGAIVDGKALHRPKWNSLLDHMHVLAKQRLGAFDAVRKISGANVREGRYEESGFHYLPEAGLSVQGVDSNLAWEHSLGIARQLRVAIEVTLEWRNKEGAAHPGKDGVIRWSPPSLAVAR